MQTIKDWNSPEDYAILGYYDQVNPDHTVTKYQVRLSPMGTEYYVPVNEDRIPYYKTGTAGRTQHTMIRSVNPTRFSRKKAEKIFGTNRWRTLGDIGETTYSGFLESALGATSTAATRGETIEQQFATASTRLIDDIAREEENVRQANEEVKIAQRIAADTARLAETAYHKAETLSSVLAENEANRAAREAIHEEELLRKTMPIFYKKTVAKYTIQELKDKAVEDAIKEAETFRTIANETAAVVPLFEAEKDKAYRILVTRNSPNAKNKYKEATKLFKEAQKNATEAAERAEIANKTALSAAQEADDMKRDFEETYELVSRLKQTVPEKIRIAEQTDARARFLQSPEAMSAYVEAERESRAAAEEAYVADQRFKLALTKAQQYFIRLNAAQRAQRVLKKYLTDVEDLPEDYTIGGRGRIRAPLMTMGETAIPAVTGGGRKSRSRSPPRVAAGGDGGGASFTISGQSFDESQNNVGSGLSEIMMQDQIRRNREEAKQRAEFEGMLEADRIKAAEKEKARTMYMTYLRNKGINSTGITAIRDLRKTAKSVVLEELGAVKKGPHASGQVEAIERTYDETLSATNGDVNQAEKAARDLRAALQYGESIGIVEENLKGKIPEIGTPGRLLIDEFQLHGEAAAEKLKRELLKVKILENKGGKISQHPSFFNSVGAFEEKEKAKHPSLVQNKGKTSERIKLERSVASKESKEEKAAAKEEVRRAVEEYGLRFMSTKLGKSVATPSKRTGGKARSKSPPRAAGGGGGRLSRIAEEEEDEEGFRPVKGGKKGGK